MVVKDYLNLWAGFYERIRNDIFLFCREGLRFEPTEQQKEALRLIQNEALRPSGFKYKKQIAIKSVQGCGKTTITNVAAAWWTLRWPGAICYVTSPAMHHAKQVWLAEFRRTFKNAHPFLQKFIHTTKTSVQFGTKNPDWAIRLVTASKVEAIAGRHADHQYIIVEEATGIETGIWETLIGTQSGDDNLTLAISNPTASNTDFGACFSKNRPHWHCLTFSALDTPLVSEDHIHKMKDSYGEESDIYRIRVLGLFPSKDPDVVIDPEWCVTATQADSLVCAEIGGYTKAIGIDFARMGGDENVVAQRIGWSLIHLWAKARCEPDDALQYAFDRQRQMGWKNNECEFVIDATGIGQAMIKRAQVGDRKVFTFHNHGIPASRMYANKITEAYFELANLLKEGVVHLPDDDILIAQLSSRKYNYNKKGQMELESKKVYRKRVGDSPDRADAVVMAFYRRTSVLGQIANIDHHKKLGPQYDDDAE